MSTTRCLAALSISASVTASFAAPSPVGTWKGRLHMDLSKVTAQQRQQMAPFTGMLAKMKVSLTLKRDHTFTSNAEGLPNMKGARRESGTWSMKGYTVTLKSTNDGGQPQSCTISKDGRSMHLALPSASGAKSEFVFTR